MPFVSWKDAYRTGWSAYDGQHQALFALVNELQDRLEAFAPGKEDALERCFAAFTKLVAEHAALEDRLMAELGHPPATDHAQAHHRFLEGLQGLRDAGDFGTSAHPALREALAKFKTHFEGEDEQGFLVLLRARFLS